MDEKVKEYKMGISNITTNEKKNFVKFYSSGPALAGRSEPYFVIYHQKFRIFILLMKK